jgi:hypothetical protein
MRVCLGVQQFLRIEFLWIGTRNAADDLGRALL